jgi:pyroglutamyl-peptidase
VTPERLAVNLDAAHIPDNAGRQPMESPVVPGGPAAYWSTLPVTKIVEALRKRGIPAAVSMSAGTFVCNHVFYGLMHELAQGESLPRRGARGGFIHVPFMPAQAAGHRAQPSLPLEILVEAIAVAVEKSL